MNLNKYKKIIIESLFFIYRYYKVKVIKSYERKIYISPNPNYINILKEKIEHDDTMIKDADLIIKNKISFLGIKKYITLSQWNIDFNSDYIWRNKYYKFYKISDLKHKCDIKIPWELSRFQHMPTVGQAYKMTKDEKYSIFFRNSIEDWIENNPYMFSVNWKCAMDVSIRAINLITSINLFLDSKNLNNDFKSKMNNSLYLHGEFIYKNLEKYQNTGNHYMADIVGLIWIGIYLKNINNKETDKWLKFGLQEFEKEIFIQFNEDGTNYEASTSYHRLVTEMIILTLILCKKNNIDFNKNIYIILEKSSEFLMAITNKNGRSPLIGDNDNGRVMILSNYFNWDKSDFTHILSLAGEIFDRDDFRFIGSKHLNDTKKIVNIKSYSVNNGKYNYKSYKFENGGYYILRNKLIECIIRCGELSFHGIGTHSHNDQLSFTLNILGKEIIIDPGTYVYTANAELRNKYRKTNMHNTLQINDLEQNTIDENKLFILQEETFSKCLKFSHNTFEGEHYGYFSKIGCVHNRSIELKENSLIINDSVYTDKVDLNISIYTYLILSGKCKITNKLDNYIIIKIGELNISIDFNQNEYRIIKEEYSTEYGVRKYTNKIIVINKNIKNNRIQINLIND